ncbi:MAG: transporter related protein [Marmoricola sp.]|nr:transporter related protein [Marmoricola sp.]
MSLEVRATVAERRFDVALRVGEGEVVAVLGQNGSGKSTALSVIAGLLRPDSGSATLDGRVLFDVGGAGRSGVWVPPHDRGVALLAQEPLLFPHLSALDNVAFGPRSSGRSRREARAAGERWLHEVGASEYAGRHPGRLSGGQAQRVAVARALAAEPRLLLLDEPMSALDIDVAPAVRQMLRRVLAGRAAVIVTHDILDALLLADRIVVLEDGRVVEEGPTAQVVGRPRSPFAARIAGLNMVRGTRDGDGVRGPDGVRVEGLADEAVPDGEPAVAVFRPSAVGVYRRPPGGSPRNVLDVTITELEPVGEQIRVRTAGLSADVTAAAVAELDLAPGTRVVFTVKASEVTVYRA